MVAFFVFVVLYVSACVYFAVYGSDDTITNMIAAPFRAFMALGIVAGILVAFIGFPVLVFKTAYVWIIGTNKKGQ